jgi:DNA invertase Pin-like site-specific DNA recombinase
MEGDMAVYGYARVSTDGQSLAAQLAELKAAKCEKTFQEKTSGARSDRKQLAKMMALLATYWSSPGSIGWHDLQEIS